MPSPTRDELATRYLDQLPDKIRDTVGTGVGTDAWGLQRDVFLAGLGELMKSLPTPKLVSADKLKEAQDKYQGAIGKIGEKEKEAAVLKQQIADLGKCKDKDEVNAVARKYSSADEEFGRVCDAAKSAVGKLQHATRVAFYWKLRGDEGFQPEDNDDWEAVRTAESFEEIFSNRFFAASDSKIYEPALRHPRVAKAENALQELQNFLSDPKDKDFVKRFEDEYQFPASLGNRDFWRKFLAYV